MAKLDSMKQSVARASGTTPEPWMGLPKGFPKGVETLPEIIAFLKSKFRQETLRGAIGVVRAEYQNNLKGTVSELDEKTTPEMTKLAKYIEMVYNKFGTTAKELWKLVDDGTSQWGEKSIQEMSR